MSSVFLFFLLLLVICCTLFVSAHYASGETDLRNAAESVTFLKTSNKISNIYNKEGTKIESDSDGSITPKDFYSPFLVATNDKIVALTGVNNTDKPIKKINILANYNSTENLIKWFTEASGDSSTNDRTTQYAVKEEQQDNKNVKFIFAAASNDKIYILLVNNSAQGDSGAVDWDCVLFVGAKNDVESNEAQIKWTADKEAKNGNNFAALKEKLKDKFKEHAPSVGSVLLTETGNFFFVLQLKKKTGEKIPFAFIQMGETEKTVKFADLDEKENGCTFKLFAWKENIMLAEYCTNNKKLMHEVQLNNEKLIQTNESISRLLHHFKDKNNFIAAKINTQSVLLFTQQQKSTDQDTDKTYWIDLWMTDGSRLHNVGSVVSSKNDEVTSAGLLYTKEKQLFLLHEKTEGESKPKSIILTHLKEQLGKINTKLEQWKTNHKNIKELYKDTATRENLISTDGLVGFLFGTKRDEDKEWTNVYHNFDATINERGAEKLEIGNGFKFTGAGAGAQWSVTKQENDQPYNFKDPGFTLVATVTVGKGTNSDDISILGVVLADNPKKNVGLWCTKNGKWAVKVGDGQTNIPSSDINCTRNEKYYVAVILNNNNKLFIYVDGEQIPKSDNEGIDIQQSQNIDYFYFGVNKNKQSEKTDVTITGVLLYNLPFEDNKVKKLKPKKEKRVSPEQKREGDNSDLPTDDESTIQTDNSSPGTSATPTATEKDGAETKLCLFFMNSVTVLSLLLFVGFSLLGRYV